MRFWLNFVNKLAENPATAFLSENNGSIQIKKEVTVMRFSIIIPVYNVEKYIRKCMQTVMEQTFRDYEVIVVDDETPDNSMAIVEEFAQRYPDMIKIIHQKNTRQGGARNRGVQEAQGEYLLFVDSDDYVDTHMLEVVDAHLRRVNCDILSFQCRIVAANGRVLWEEGNCSLNFGCYVPNKDKEILLLTVSPCLKAYRRSFYLATEYAFPEKLLYEDTTMRILFAKASSIVLVKDCLYYYVMSPNSSVRGKHSAKTLDILKTTDRMLEQFRADGLYDTFREPLEASAIGGILYIFDLINLANKDDELQFPIAAYLTQHFPDYAANPYLERQQCKGMAYLMKCDFRGYYYHVTMVAQVKKWLLGWKWIEKMNQFRHRLQKAF